jgi:Fe-S cluster biogenesis protein NfuA/nitrite reductase/ring-hydroxylating ferredoxin subunit
MDDIAARELVGQVEGLLEQLEALPDRVAREQANDTVAALLDLYGAALERIVEEVAAVDADGRVAATLGEDELVSHVLLLHGLHPSPLEKRVQEALDGVRPYLASHGGNVELRGVEDGVVKLALEGSCSGCPSSTVTLKLAIEDAIHKAAPDVVEIVAEGIAPETSVPGRNGNGNGQLIQLEPPQPAASGPGPSEPASGPEWAMAGGMPELQGDRPLLKNVSGEAVLFLRLAGTIYAYRPDCPGCGESLRRGALEATALACADCGNRYDVLRGGRCLDEPQLHLEPLPLLVDESGLVKVALGAAA